MRELLGLKFFKELEKKTYRLLIERKIIKAKGMLADAAVFPEEIKYPNDVGLLNDVREWLVGNIKRIGKTIGKNPICFEIFIRSVITSLLMARVQALERASNHLKKNLEHDECFR